MEPARVLVTLRLYRLYPGLHKSFLTALDTKVHAVGLLKSRNTCRLHRIWHLLRLHKHLSADLLNRIQGHSLLGFFTLPVQGCTPTAMSHTPLPYRLFVPAFLEALNFLPYVVAILAHENVVVGYTACRRLSSSWRHTLHLINVHETLGEGHAAMEGS